MGETARKSDASSRCPEALGRRRVGGEEEARIRVSWRDLRRCAMQVNYCIRT
ncbi:hypothetical protein L873DRAFT_1803539 [Choiromyces venosus 120613-1]|uniref:Uncharacterized protein n=1 Tax=Choiromyces venosus 120613-1 TaxID=1336337 RepID=A0A3N4IUH2_9PEZI|nr:hypothetical protein L873DRAFT_1822513 [Choiromyces venosus 120613-1]RPB01687.1 hypothetical protein L873DRAFT_1803539 [Choiromyces venosus 120613-1]